ncbi:L-lactate dehydrogenase [Gryllus bimaculatus]|nr:L-lactate dehydrogenase [Gryllus bimaculatus]
MTYVAWKLSGLPCHRVIGTGCALDSARFRFFIGDRLNVRPSNVHSWVIGEHGDSSVPVWSGVDVAGLRLREINPDVGTEDDKEKFSELHTKVVRSAYDVIQLKGYTSWAIGLTGASVTRSFLRNTGEINAVSIFAKGYFGIDKDVYLSLPCVLGRGGVSHVLRMRLTEEEACRLRKSADVIHEVVCSVKL